MEENLGQLLKSGLLKNTSDALKALVMYILPFADNLSEDEVASSKAEWKTRLFICAEQWRGPIWPPYSGTFPN